MQVLLVDNQSAHLAVLQELIVEKLGKVDVVIRDPRDMSDEDITGVDLVIFSGGTGRSIEKNPQTFSRMVNLVIKYQKPTIGICLGAEAIATRFGSVLKEMPIRRVGNVRSFFTNFASSELTQGQDSAMFYEFHKWLIEDVKDPLVSLATSKDGIELFRHKQFPLWGMQFHPEVRHLDNHGQQIFEHVLREFRLIK